MSVYIVARLSQGGKQVGYKLYDTKTQRCVSWQTSRILEALKFNALHLRNAEIGDDDKLQGTQGVLKSYPELDIETDNVVGKNSYTIVGKDDEEGLFHTVDAYGIPREMSERSLIKSLSNRGLTNAMLVKNVKEPYIRAKGAFEMVGFKYDYLEKEFNTPNIYDRVKKWKVRIIKTGEPYGRNGVLTNDKKPLVEFISMDTKQFVSRYYLETLLERDLRDTYGLNLQGDVPAWSIDGEGYKKIDKWLRGLSL